MDKKQKQELLDTYWLEIIFFLIGEHADQHAHQVKLLLNSEIRNIFIFFLKVNGAVVNIRGRTDKLAVWLADANQSESILSIGTMLKERLKLGATIGFSVHNEEKIHSRGAQQKYKV